MRAKRAPQMLAAVNMDMVTLSAQVDERLKQEQRCARRVAKVDNTESVMPSISHLWPNMSNPEFVLCWCSPGRPHVSKPFYYDDRCVTSTQLHLQMSSPLQHPLNFMT